MEIGQTPSSIKYDENMMASYGEKAVEAALLVQMTWLGAWWAKPILDWLVGIVGSFMMKWFDRSAYAGWVAVQMKIQISDFIKAEDSGDQSEIDKTGDDFVHIGHV